MSHFSVLVITGEKPDQESLEKILAPFHEFECTGRCDAHVKSIDITEEARKNYAEDTKRRFRAPDGTLYDAYDNQFYRDPTEEERAHIGPLAGTGAGGGMSWASQDWNDGKGYRTKVHFCPDGFEAVIKKTEEVESFGDFINGYYGYERADLLDVDGAHKFGYYRVNDLGDVVEVVKRTNPNKKWDWWQIGGRFSGMLTPKLTIYARPLDFENAPTKGEPGLMGAQRDELGADIIRKGDVDFADMRRRAKERAEDLWDKVRAIVDPHLGGFAAWEDVREKMFPGKIAAAREFYNAQPAIVAVRDAAKDRKDGDLFWMDNMEHFFLSSREAVAQRAADKSAATFAAIKDGAWIERGEMGMFGCVSNEMSHDDWCRQFNTIVDDLSDDAWLAVVDCHI